MFKKNIYQKMKLFKTEKKLIHFNTHIIPTIKKAKILFNTQKYILENKPKEELTQYSFLKKKINKFKVQKYIEFCQIRGRWSFKEHLLFLQALDKYGPNWRKITDLIPNRTGIQIRTHANKFYKKLKKYKDEELGIDFTSDSINSIKDMIDHIKNVNNNLSVYQIFLSSSQIPISKKTSKNTEETDNEEKNDINDIIDIDEEKEKEREDIVINNNKKEINLLNQKNNNNIVNNYDNNINNINIIKINPKNKLIINPSNNHNFDNQFYNYLNYAIFSNIFQIINQISSDKLNNYLLNLKNCSILDFQNNNSTDDNDSNSNNNVSSD